MINKKNGHLNISPETELAPNDPFEKIRNLKLGEVQGARDMTNGYKWLDFKNVKIGSKYFNLSFGFFENKLKMLDFVVDDKKLNLNEDWDTWKEAEEKTKVQAYKKWLVAELGHEEQFFWGEISASYDPRSGSSSISINYKK